MPATCRDQLTSWIFSVVMRRETEDRTCTQSGRSYRLGLCIVDLRRRGRVDGGGSRTSAQEVIPPRRHDRLDLFQVWLDSVCVSIRGGVSVRYVWETEQGKWVRHLRCLYASSSHIAGAATSDVKVYNPCFRFDVDKVEKDKARRKSRVVCACCAVLPCDTCTVLVSATTTTVAPICQMNNT